MSQSIPRGSHLVTAWYPVAPEELRLLFDLTYVDDRGEVRREQEIFDTVFDLIEQAETFLVLDFFLYNDFAGDPEGAYRSLSSELTRRLLTRRKRSPELPILLITDPINTVYGSEFHDGYTRLREHGIDVVETNLLELRDSNPWYSTFYRLFFRWFGNRRGSGWLPNPFLPGDTVTLRSYLALLNFKANHRKVVVAGLEKGPPLALLTSANPHDASSSHSNAGIRFRNRAGLELLESELEIARFSDWRGGTVPRPESEAQNEEARPESLPRLRVITEGAITMALLEAIEQTGNGDQIEMAMFYLAHRKIIRALIAASRRNVSIRLILDANRDAFGITKSGIPNRPVAHELIKRSSGRIEIRWYDTHGEQFHTKLTVVRCGDTVRTCLGSANLTRRNLDDLNLEANAELECRREDPIDLRLSDYFDRLWSNRTGRYTLPYEAFSDGSSLARLRYRVSEASGLSTF